jgi:hydroxymethylpyrimidine pyrophosphatase-like HAD family hydrolase
MSGISAGMIVSRNGANTVMRYLVLATDYDNTLASDGRVAAAACEALDRLRASGRRAILVTGRRLDDLLRLCGECDAFDYVVAENGALLYEPASRETTLLAELPPEQFVAALRRRGVQPLEVGKVIVATHAWAWSCSSSSTARPSWCFPPASTRHRG